MLSVTGRLITGAFICWHHPATAWRTVIISIVALVFEQRHVSSGQVTSSAGKLLYQEGVAEITWYEIA